MELLKAVGEAFPYILKWIGIIAGSILAPTISAWAIVRLVKWIFRKLSSRN